MQAAIGCRSISVYLDSIRKHFSILRLLRVQILTKRGCRPVLKYSIRPMDFDTVLADPEIEMVINLTNPSAHYLITKQALLHGKHVFSEKMIAVTLEEGRNCRAGGKDRVRLGVAPDTFLGGALQTARHVIEMGPDRRSASFVASLNRDYGISAASPAPAEERRWHYL